MPIEQYVNEQYVRNDTKQLWWWKQQECESINETCICEYNDTNCDENSEVCKNGKWNCVLILKNDLRNMCRIDIVLFEIWTEKQCDIGVQEKPCNLNWQWLLIKVYVSE